MIKVYQTKHGIEGNCFNACLASILEIDIGKLPDTDDGMDWLKTYKEFLKPFNLSIHWMPPIGSNRKPFGYAIGSFKRIGKPYNHAIVCLNGRKKHDPSLGNGKVGKLDCWFVITAPYPSINK